MKENPRLRTRPVNVHIPSTGHKVEVPRNYAKSAGKALQGAGAVTSVISGLNDFNRYKSGEVSGAHLTVNLIMNGVGFAGPWGAGASIVYSMIEDYIW